jgi:hypothetical protein
MTQGSYISESTQDLIKRSQQILGEEIIFPPTNEFDPNWTINAMAGPCYGITIKNTISGISMSIVTCTGTAPTTCASPGTCPTTPDPTTYINMVVTFTAVAAQSTGATITFQYVLNGTPTTTVITPGTGGAASIVAGSNTYYAFATNVQYPPDTTLVLYGVNIQT